MGGVICMYVRIISAYHVHPDYHAVSLSFFGFFFSKITRKLVVKYPPKMGTI